MNLIKRIGSLLPSFRQPMPNGGNDYFGFSNGITLYTQGKDETYINKGYQKNAWVYAIVSKCASKFSQVPWYHYKINRRERKTYFEEYLPLTKNFGDVRAVLEAKRMLKKSVEQVVVDDEVSKLLNKPNRNMTGTQFREQLYGYKLLTGEGNFWKSRPTDKDGRQDPNKPPTELFIIPKNNLALVGGVDPWDIRSYKLLFGGREYENDKRNITLWKFPNYNFNPVTLEHLRGQAPLDAGLLLMQASNEGAERMAIMNKNQGVAGAVYRKDQHQQPTVEQAMFMRRQFDSIVNDKDLAGTIAYLTGDLGFMQFGMSAEQLKLLEQIDYSIEWLCNIFNYPPGLMTKDQTYENQKQQERSFIYNHIAPQCYSLRDELNNLLTDFQLDRESHAIDCGIADLPELSEDLKTQVEAVKEAWWLTPNQRLEYMGFDRGTDPNMDKIYIPNSLQTLEQANSDMGGSLDNDLTLLGEDK